MDNIRLILIQIDKSMIFYVLITAWYGKSSLFQQNSLIKCPFFVDKCPFPNCFDIIAGLWILPLTKLKGNCKNSFLWLATKIVSPLLRSFHGKGFFETGGLLWNNSSCPVLILLFFTVYFLWPVLYSQSDHCYREEKKI